MKFFAKRWLVRDADGDALVLVASGSDLSLRRAGLRGELLHAYQSPSAVFDDAWANKDFYVRGGQRKRVVRAALFDEARPGGAYRVQFANIADGKSFKRWLERHGEK